MTNSERTGQLVTPIYAKATHDMSWPDEAAFYLLTADGLFLCRNHRFFCSSVPAPGWPAELDRHTASLKPRYPKLPQERLEQVIAFFAHVGEFSAEAVALLAFNEQQQTVEFLVPEQVALVGRNVWGDTWPISVEYQHPADIPAHLTVFGDIHSHVDGPAYSSGVDQHDEVHRPGLHVIVGRIFDREPPDFHVEAVVDRTRFKLAHSQILEGYEQRAETFPAEWLDRLKIKWPRQEPSSLNTIRILTGVARDEQPAGNAQPPLSKVPPSASATQQDESAPALLDQDACNQQRVNQSETSIGDGISDDGAPQDSGYGTPPNKRGPAGT